MTKKGKSFLFRGLGVLCAFLCAFLFGAYSIAAGSDYKSMVDGFLGVGGTAGSADASAYAFNSDYKNTTEMLTARKALAEQIAAEGCVLLKNENGVLPLRANPEDGTRLNVTLLGSRAYTYDTSGKLRDERDGKRLSAYGGLTGSVILEQSVVTADGKQKLPVTLEMGLESENIFINPTAKTAYNGKNFPNYVSGSEANGSQGGPFASNEPMMSLGECGSYQNYKDACLVFIGRPSGEGREYFPGANGLAAADGATCALGLTDSERNLIDVANEIAPGKVIVLLNSAVAMETDELKNNDKVNAVMWIGLPGSYGMTGVAKVLSGKISASGKLPDIHAVAASNSPAAQNFGVASQGGTPIAWANQSAYNGSVKWYASSTHYVVLAEGLYTGYRYYETRYADYVYNRNNADSSVGSSTDGEWKYENEVAYTFGYGMEYVDFSEEIVADSLKVDYENKTVSLDIKVTNEGTRTAKHAVQLYVQAPYTEYDKTRGVEKSAIQLLNFAKVELEAGASKTVTVTGDMKYIASYDKTASHDGKTGGYILDAGKYYFAIGNGAHEALNNAIALEGNADTSRMYSETGATINEKGAIVWDTTADTDFAVDSNGVNTSLISTTSEGGAIVENQMQNADYNYYKANTVTYLTRSDWEGTFPKAYTNLEVTDAMIDHLNNDIYKFKSGTVDTVFGYDHADDIDEVTGEPMENKTVAEYKLKAFDDAEWEYLLDQVTFYEAWFLAPYGGTENEAIASVASPIAWQIDGPNGNVSRSIGAKAKTSGPYAVAKNDANYGYMSCDMPCEPMIAATFNQELIKEEGKMFGEDFIWNGNAMVWAPGMNLHRTPFNSRNHEYYSEDPMLTNLIGGAFVEGGLEKGAILAAKHFAFNTQESYREGLGQFMEEQSARELELRGFEGALSDASYVNSAGNKIGALGLMSTFSRVGVTGVNGHTGVMKNILRKEWGFKGLSSSDMVITGEFFNVEDAVINNLTFLATTGPGSLLSTYWHDWNNQAKVAADPDMCAALRENMHFYLYALANSSGLNGIDPSFVVTDSISWWQPVFIIIAVLFGLAAVASAVYSIIIPRLADKKGKKGGK